MATANAPARQGSARDFLSLLDQSRDEIAKLLPDTRTTERFMRVARTAFNMSPDIQKCDPISIISSVMKACELRLEPGGALKHAHLVPFAGQCTFQISYQGFIELAARTKLYKVCEARVVHEADQFSLSYTPEPVFRHDPYLGLDRGPLTHAYAYLKTKDGEYIFEVMAKAEIDKVRDTSKSGPAWKNWYGEMAKKTVLKRMLKRQSLSVEVAEAIDYDNAFYDLDGQQVAVTRSPNARRGLASLNQRALAAEPVFSTSRGVDRPLRTEAEPTDYDVPPEDENPPGRMPGED